MELRNDRGRLTSWRKVIVCPFPAEGWNAETSVHRESKVCFSQRVSVPRSCLGSFYTPAKDCKSTSTQVLKKKKERARSAHSAALQIACLLGSWEPVLCKAKNRFLWERALVVRNVSRWLPPPTRNKLTIEARRGKKEKKKTLSGIEIKVV